VLAQATGVDTRVAGALEQNIFYVNQVMQTEILAVLQPNPATPRSRSPPLIALAVDSDLFEKKNNSESIPILRNLCGPVLAGTARSHRQLDQRPACRNIRATASGRSRAAGEGVGAMRGARRAVPSPPALKKSKLTLAIFKKDV